MRSIQSVSLAARRRLSERMRTGKLNPGDWGKFALVAAEEAHENNFSSHRGAYPVGGDGPFEVLVIYDNHPYASFPRRRDAELAEFRRRLGELGVKELGFATYPISGPSVGYTFALVVEAGEDRMPELCQIGQDIISEQDRKHAAEREEEPAFAEMMANAHAVAMR